MPNEPGSYALLTGALGALGILGRVIQVLWREHQSTDRAMETDRDYWRTLALTGVEVADKSTDLAVGRSHPQRRA